ncbi:ABC1 kinase family protein [Merismopedia glauca]|uniref:Protein kinase domain-containing protein n=1 Tax=Merismopedia glauca CCAP 1448/3 TaxID=1296344 RepID=A0A2T1C4V2_9CYAN|nr:AarF/ABC1/UbiB kinase family protein [Merismopedia glauca]PSB03289.1 hypothetical protein C7B64_09345 [Merismopedia glauca CCAP 1448/3]
MEKSNTTVVSVAEDAQGHPALTVSYELLPPTEEIISPNQTYEPALRYDADAIAKYYRRRPFQVWWRYLNTFVPLLSFGFKTWWDKRTQQTESNAKKRAIQLRKMLTKFGPAYIKMGQALSTRPDLMSATFLEELSLLQDQLPAFSNEIAFNLIEKELGSRPEQIYAELTPNPIAAASLGQVYKGRLHTGEEVALKVQRPGLRERIELDVYILRSLAAWAKKNFKFIRSDLVGILDEFATRLFEEMDYIQEGKHAERFERLYGKLPEIYVPKIYWQYTSRRVLTMEWINGTKLTNVEEVRRRGIDATHMINVGVQCSLRQLLEHGFFHADPHPGNLLATNDGKLAYLDFGMMSEVKPAQRYGLIEAVVHMVNRDFEGLAQDYVNLDFLTPDTDLTPIIPALGNVFGNALGASVAELNFKSITDQMSNLMYEYPFRVPAYYALIIRCLVTLEGIAIGIDPNFKVLSKAYPYIAKRLLTDPAPELRLSLQELLFKDGSFRWNRLENLLLNARSSEDYDLSKVLDQTIEFLFSERGAFIRENLADEIVKSIDELGQRTLHNVSHAFRQTVGLAVPETSERVENPNNLDRVKRIWDILQETRGFDAMQLLPVIPQLLVKPETQKMGQTIASRLAQRVATRLIREVLLPNTPPSMPQNGSQRSLPPAQK